MKNIAIIMAGGKSKRYCEKANTTTLKQFVILKNGRTLIEETVRRISKIVPYDDVYIVMNKKHEILVKKLLRNIPSKNIIAEPLNKNTAPCIGYVGMVIKKRCGDANIIILPCDHIINDIVSFEKDILLALNNINNEKTILFGIKPDRIETGYGYIKASSTEKDICEVLKFDEKPNYNLAKRYINNNDYLWNCGIYITKCSTLLNNMELFLPNLYVHLDRIYKNIDDVNLNEIVVEEYKTMKSESIDCGIIEKSSNLNVIRASFDWDDFGSTMKEGITL